MTRTYSSKPIKSVVKEGIPGNTNVPDMDAQNLPFESFEPSRTRGRGTEGELDTLEGDPLWVLL